MNGTVGRLLLHALRRRYPSAVILVQHVRTHKIVQPIGPTGTWAPDYDVRQRIEIRFAVRAVPEPGRGRQPFLSRHPLRWSPRESCQEHESVQLSIAERIQPSSHWSPEHDTGRRLRPYVPQTLRKRRWVRR